MRYCGQDDPVVAHAVALLGHTPQSMPMHVVIKGRMEGCDSFHVRATTFRTTVTWHRSGMPEVTYEAARNGTGDDRTIYVAEIWPRTILTACAGRDVNDLITIPGMTSTTIATAEISSVAGMTLLKLSPLEQGRRE